MARTPRGFSVCDPLKQREIARKGGKALPDEKRFFSRNPDRAAEAGRKGGLAKAANAAKRNKE